MDDELHFDSYFSRFKLNLTEGLLYSFLYDTEYVKTPPIEYSINLEQFILNVLLFTFEYHSQMEPPKYLLHQSQCWKQYIPIYVS